jgi:hypothetical protein
MTSNTTGFDEGDLLYGIGAIADFLNMRKRQAYHLHTTSSLPTFKIGGKVCARRSTLRGHIAEIEAIARNRPFPTDAPA